MENKYLSETKLSALNKRAVAFSQGYRQNVSIIGDDRDEISFLLDNSLQSLPEIINIHCRVSYATKREFFKNVAASLLGGYSRKEESLDNLIAITGPSLNLTVSFIKSVLKKNNISLTDVLETINKFITESKKKCIFIIEDFLVLKELFPNYFKEFAKFIMLQRNCMIILASSSPRDAQKIIEGELNLLFGNFEKIFLNENSFLGNYINFKKLLGSINPSPLFISFFTNLLGSNVVYHNLLSESIKKNYCAHSEEESIVSVIKEAMYRKETYLFQKFLQKIDIIKERFKDYDSLLRLLIALSDKYIRREELISLNVCPAKDTVTKLSKLCDMDYVANYGNIYKISDPLFSFWLAYVFKYHYLLSSTDIKKRDDAWRKTIGEEIAFFKEDFLKDKIKRILELIASFKNDALRIGKNKYRLPAIEKTKIISFAEKGTHFLIGEGREIIFAAIKEGTVEDADVMEFIERSNSIKGKGVKKIVVSFEKITPEARLVVKNNKLIAWDIDELNGLLRLYNKPLISLQNELVEANNENTGNI